MLAAFAAPRFSAARIVVVDDRLRRPARIDRVWAAEVVGCYHRVRVLAFSAIPRHFIFHLSSLIIRRERRERRERRRRLKKPKKCCILIKYIMFQFTFAEVSG